jgi:murein L,D-transpeptidase YafK
MRFIFLTIMVVLLAIPQVSQASIYGRSFKKARYIQIYKSKRTLMLYDEHGQLMKKYRVSLGKNPVGHKRKEGDKRTPEGRYFIETRNPDSNYHLSLKISYPNHNDWNRAQRFGDSPGGMIMIHGLPNGKEWIKKYHKNKDWTDGCIAVNNEEIREIWRLVDDGTPVDIFP